MKKKFFKNYNINQNVRSSVIRLIDNNSNYLGLFKIKDCLKKAKFLNVDLVEVNWDGVFSVCKLIKFAKFNYLRLKKFNKIVFKKPKFRKRIFKEMYFNSVIYSNDYKNKLNKVKKILSKKYDIKIFILTKGREVIRKYAKRDLSNNLIRDLTGFAYLRNSPNFVIRNTFLYFVAKSK